ncbi:hypothetical protein Mal4_49600 [Maioricimonas rarisocia]|uniref:Uncharacterized protein n=1 Tax=Maioricimonas rarisocia TaxID=2528026 RepID=A0A517ZDP3_9PLAN|nr:hypothetical protein [Maioricimonas rarisocia]QDU40602.1 hypothetical protein Mal4_49600 [Maioricimonas rarisocia]
MFHQLLATILIAATLLAQCAPWGEAADALPSTVDAGKSTDGADFQVLPAGMQQVAALRLITSQSIRLGRTEVSSGEADPARLLPVAAAPSQPGYSLTGRGWLPWDGLEQASSGPAVDRNPPLRL